MNKIIISGHLGKDAETTNLGESNVTKFSIATSDGWGDKKTTNWHNIVAWNKEKLAPYLVKGSKLIVVGRLENRSWTAKDGSTRWATEIVAEEIEFAGEKKEQSTRESQITSFESQDGSGGNDELPF